MLYSARNISRHPDLIMSFRKLERDYPSKVFDLFFHVMREALTFSGCLGLNALTRTAYDLRMEQTKKLKKFLEDSGQINSLPTFYANTKVCIHVYHMITSGLYCLEREQKSRYDERNSQYLSELQPRERRYQSTIQLATCLVFGSDGPNSDEDEGS